MALTPEELAANLAKGRATVAANRKAAAEKRELEKAEALARQAVGIEPEPAPVAMPPIVHEGAASEAVIVEEPNAVLDEIEDRFGEPIEGMGHFERFLADQDSETRELLTDVELRVIYETETKRAQDEKKAAARKLVVARAQRHAKATAGLLPANAIAAAALRDRQSQKVRWTVNMPEAGNSGMLIDEGLRINGQLLRHGQEIVCTMGEYESYRSIEWLAHDGELAFQGRSKMSKLRQTATGFLNMKGASL